MVTLGTRRWKFSSHLARSKLIPAEWKIQTELHTRNRTLRRLHTERRIISIQFVRKIRSKFIIIKQIGHADIAHISQMPTLTGSIIDALSAISRLLSAPRHPLFYIRSCVSSHRFHRNADDFSLRKPYLVSQITRIARYTQKINTFGEIRVFGEYAEIICAKLRLRLHAIRTVPSEQYGRKRLPKGNTIFPLFPHCSRGPWLSAPKFCDV